MRSYQNDHRRIVKEGLWDLSYICMWWIGEACGGGFEIEKSMEHDEARIFECVVHIIGNEVLNIMPLTASTSGGEGGCHERTVYLHLDHLLWVREVCWVADFRPK